MAYYATQEETPQLWEFLQGNIHDNTAIGLQRRMHLEALSEINGEDVVVTCRDAETDRWTKHLPWTKDFLEIRPSRRGRYISSSREYFPHLTTAIEIHRAQCSNEVIIESDYPEYAVNVAASKVIGAILENAGFVPHYYYSGGKSIHIHLYFDWNCLNSITSSTKKEIISIFETRKEFAKKFIFWLRSRCIGGWGVSSYKFDQAFLSEKHKIRMELSRHKFGFKTFCGYTHTDLSLLPPICNEQTKILPVCGQIKLSRPVSINTLADEFLHEVKSKRKKDTLRHKEQSLWQYYMPEERGAAIRKCVTFLLSPAFAQATDGFQRAMFILVNELKKIYSESECLQRMDAWNAACGDKVLPADILYRIQQSTQYVLTCEYIHRFIQELGFEPPDRCS